MIPDFTNDFPAAIELSRPKQTLLSIPEKADLVVTQWENRRNVKIWSSDRKNLVTLIENALLEFSQHQ
jgi:hypothetical protein